jgi:undecaprenyl diphosphate synthase
MENIEPIVLAARDFGVEHVIVYAFSTENWSRSEGEISFLMQIFEGKLQEGLKRLSKDRGAVRFIGQRDRLKQSLQDSMGRAEANNPADPQIILWICLSYGGKADIAQAAQAAAKQSEITEETITENLWTRGMPDPDLIIRTGGEQRISNFLIWQAAYSELFFVKAYWPAFTKEDLKAVLDEYAVRERRMGK